MICCVSSGKGVSRVVDGYIKEVETIRWNAKKYLYWLLSEDEYIALHHLSTYIQIYIKKVLYVTKSNI